MIPDCLRCDCDPCDCHDFEHTDYSELIDFDDDSDVLPPEGSADEC